ncbi:MAG: hypothetical protein ACLTMP_08920 [Eggerthella lenta]
MERNAMDGRAKRGESLAGKTIALAAVLVTLLAAGTLLSACATTYDEPVRRGAACYSSEGV